MSNCYCHPGRAWGISRYIRTSGIVGTVNGQGVDVHSAQVQWLRRKSAEWGLKKRSGPGSRVPRRAGPRLRRSAEARRPCKTSLHYPSSRQQHEAAFGPRMLDYLFKANEESPEELLYRALPESGMFRQLVPRPAALARSGRNSPPTRSLFQPGRFSAPKESASCDAFAGQITKR